ncbi:hypothetical protein CRG98_006389 [Punica granatum]|uniref:Uncharacterized protein n=1 Tax=Punica granatum TaxID=22663 RepID=A0A2I0KXR1_PUNGR|nr:hypothetical protein CRG98_006389 [Punica granatum]
MAKLMYIRLTFGGVFDGHETLGTKLMAGQTLGTKISRLFFLKGELCLVKFHVKIGWKRSEAEAALSSMVGQKGPPLLIHRIQLFAAAIGK